MDKEQFIRIYKKGIELNAVEEDDLSIPVVNKYKRYIEHNLTTNPRAIESLQASWARQFLAVLLKRPNTEPPGAKAERN